MEPLAKEKLKELEQEREEIRKKYAKMTYKPKTLMQHRKLKHKRDFKIYNYFEPEPIESSAQDILKKWIGG